MNKNAPIAQTWRWSVPPGEEIHIVVEQNNLSGQFLIYREDWDKGLESFVKRNGGRMSANTKDEALGLAVQMWELEQEAYKGKSPRAKR